MPLEVARTRKLLADFDFKQLFIEELGWNRHDARLQVPVDSQSFSLTAVAEKCGMAAFLCGPEAGGRIPEYSIRRKIERQVAKTAHEHLIVFVDGNQTAQIWQWVRREQSKPAACREHTYHKGQPGDSLIQKLQVLAVSLEEEENWTLPDQTSRARRAFDVERVTKKFYDRFEKEHDAFLEFVEGIPDKDMERWYVSVMLNRLMFIYFVQKKGFLDNDPDYLKNKLAQCRRELGKDHYYRDFLCPLFFEGFAKQKQDRSEIARRLFGGVPYLNGGIFTEHQVEQLHGETIAIPDKAFEKLLDFFDYKDKEQGIRWQWHLDERPRRRDDEINPDVLGYIFEKYINRKQMGAYYTKEDITEYISKNTVIPYLFDATREKCKIAFEGDRSAWRLLQEDPDRYIYKAVRHGITWDYRAKHRNQGEPLAKPRDLPAEIADGLDTSKQNLIERRKVWNRPAPAEYALPTEIWREVVARRKRYEEVRDKLAAGEVRSINDLITYNLDIRQFAQDVIEDCEGPELLKAFWVTIAGHTPENSNEKPIQAMSILDPACGSGAFLFAALNILEPLYEACLDRMRFFLDEWGENGRRNHPNYHKLFAGTLDHVAVHSNPRYFVFKSIIVNNLYGVDIMEEAVEICKLRLFLKLMAQVEKDDRKDNMGLEPLPDIDFNIRAGNTLVGFTSVDEIRQAANSELAGRIQQKKMMFSETDEAIRRIEEEAEIADREFRQFRYMQTEQGMAPKDFAEAKETLRKRLGKLTDELDRFLAGEYGISPDKFRKDKMAEYEAAFSEWQKNHRPFHWFAGFHGILKAGGFDVIIGNPPYVEYAKIQGEYTIHNYRTEKCGNLYAYFLERATKLAGIACRSGFITPMAGVASHRTQELRELLGQSASVLYVSSYAGDAHPSILFEGVRLRLSIVICSHAQTRQPSTLYTTIFQRWYAAERGLLFPRMTLWATDTVPLWNIFPRLGGMQASNVWFKLLNVGTEARLTSHLGTGATVFYQEAAQYFVKASKRLPYFAKNGDIGAPPHGRFLNCTEAQSPTLMALLSSTLFYMWYHAVSDCYHVSDAVVQAFPCPRSVLHDPHLADLGRRLEGDLHGQAKVVEISTRTGDTIAYAAFNCQASKPILDDIDCVLAAHYGFTDEELDFIINYDIKYRMGDEIGGEDDE